MEPIDSGNSKYIKTNVLGSVPNDINYDPHINNRELKNIEDKLSSQYN